MEKMSMEELGYFLYMQEMERQQAAQAQPEQDGEAGEDWEQAE